MKLLEERILKEGRLLQGNVLQVDGFLNHQIDVSLLDALGAEWKRLYNGENITKVLTIEASGIAVACMAAKHFDVPVVFGKKTASSNIGRDFYKSSVVSYTNGNTYDVIVSKKYLSFDDRVLIIDDFLANGSALRALIKIAESAGATVVGAGVAIEKAFQRGGAEIRDLGYRVEALARVNFDKDGNICFC